MVRTGAIFNSLTYGGIDSADYGIYISGEAVYNAPERAVELVSVPGRNGAIAIDQGYWENIEVTYPAGVFGSDKTDFATAISSFRNAILSQKGYQRLTDTYHPDEYREGLYISGLEVDPVRMTTAGEFELIFNCKPQRFLTSGETEQTITSGSTLTNPTQYDASPLIKAEGYGTLTVGGKEIELTNETFGRVELAPGRTVNYASEVINLADTPMTAGDDIKISFINANITLKASDAVTDFSVVTPTKSGPIDSSVAWCTALDTDMFRASIRLAGITYAKSTSSTSVTAKATTTMSCKVGGTSVGPFTLTAQAKYVGADNTIEVSAGVSGLPASLIQVFQETLIDPVIGISTASVLGSPTYIDCDLGECYKIEGGVVVDLNRYIDLGSDLPALEPGGNTITYDNTFTSVKVVPRWWQL